MDSDKRAENEGKVEIRGGKTPCEWLFADQRLPRAYFASDPVLRSIPVAWNEGKDRRMRSNFSLFLDWQVSVLYDISKKKNNNNYHVDKNSDIIDFPRSLNF